MAPPHAVRGLEGYSETLHLIALRSASASTSRSYCRVHSRAMAEREHRGRVTGLGGIFFKAKDPKSMAQWYSRHLGMDVENSMVLFSWRGGRDGKVEGHTVWSIFPADTKYFGDDGASFMVNYRVKTWTPRSRLSSGKGFRLSRSGRPPSTVGSPGSPTRKEIGSSCGSLRRHTRLRRPRRRWSEDLPRDALAVAVEPARRIGGQLDAEEDRAAADRHASRGAAASHVRPHPSGADRVDGDPFRGQVTREDSREGIQRDLRNRIRRRPTLALLISFLQP